MSELLKELAKAGFPVASVDELRRSGSRYTAAFPVLIKALQREQDYKEKEWIVRALSVPWARPAAISPLIHEFINASEDDLEKVALLRWAIGNALDVLWDDDDFEALADLARQQRYGRSREMLVLGFGKSKRKNEAVELLEGLVADDDVSGHAIAALAKLAHPSARPVLDAATSHPKAWVRKAAKRGLHKLSK